MKIIVTGATSFIGKKIVNSLLKNNEVISMGRKFFDNPSNNEKRIVVKDFNEYEKYLEKADILIHLAWAGTTSEERVNEKLQFLNYTKSFNMIKKAINDFGIKKVILAGSQAEYGPQKCLVDENTTINPNTAYGKYKNKLYEDLKNSFKGVSIIDARIFSVYGPGQSDSFMIPSILNKMIKNEDCKFTAATQLWNYIYVDDVAYIFDKLCSLELKSFCVNLASDDTRELKEFIKIMKKVSNSKSKLFFNAIPYNTNGKLSINPNIAKLKSIIGKYKFTLFKTGVLNTINYMKGDRYVEK